MIEINYPGTNNYSQFSYDGIWRNTKIVNTTSGSVTSTKLFVWSRDDRAQALLHLGGIVLNKSIDGGVVDFNSALFHHLFEISVTDAIFAVPANAPENYLALKMSLFEIV